MNDIARWRANSGRSRAAILWGKARRQKSLLLMLLPAALLVFIFNYVTLAGWLIAFKHYQIGRSLWNAEWSGLYYFKVFFQQRGDYLYLLRNTLVMNVGSLVLNLTVAMGFAIFLNEIRNRHYKRIVQTVSFFPFFISWVIVYAIMHELFGASTGAVNQALVNAGFLKEGINLLGDSNYAWGMVWLISLWKTLGYNGVIFIAAIASIPQDQYESAEIDGAGRFGKIRHITIPNLMPTLTVLLVLNAGWVLNSDFELFFLFSNATNWSRMEVLDLYIYRFGLQMADFPYSTAVGVLKTVVSIVLVLSVNLLSKRLTSRSVI